MTKLVSILIVFTLFFSCEFDYEQLKPESFGEVGSITLILNPSILDTEAGISLKDKMDKTIYGIFPYEKIYRTEYVDIESNSNATNRQTEIIIIKVNKDAKYATPEVNVQYDLYVTNQIIISVTVNNMATLSNFILEGWDQQVMSKIDSYEMQYIANRTKKTRHKSSQEATADKFGIDMVLPNDFVVNENEKDFIWMTRKETRKNQDGFTVWVQQGILIYQVDYVNENQFNPDSLLVQRDSVLKAKVPYEGQKGWMATEYMEGFAPINKIYENEKVYHVDLMGMWKIDGDPAIHMGGPFYSTSFYNEKTGKIVTVCAYTHATGLAKRKFHLNMRAWVNSVSIN